MKSIALITLLTAASFSLIAHGNEPDDQDPALSETATTFDEQPEAKSRSRRSLAVPSTSCDEGTYLTEAGHCQPELEF